ncbi:MAG: M4 family metallopeptidase [Candidatus Glassbacteria bacterium]|nr:M4 family metallopeptidase [Candidatus Glassbacteria bacterium]
MNPPGSRKTIPLLFFLLFYLLFHISQPEVYAQKSKRSLDAAQLQALQELNNSSRPDWHVRFTSDRPVPSFLIGGTTAPIPAEPGEAGKRFLNLTRGIFRIRDAREEFVCRSVRADNLGGHHVRLDQRVGELPVFGAQMVVHSDAAGRVWMANGTYYPNDAGGSAPGISAQRAIAGAMKDLDIVPADLAGPDSCTLGFFPVEGSLRLAYRVVLATAGAKAGFHEMVCYVDAGSGAILLSYDNVNYSETATTGIGYGTGDIRRDLRLTRSETVSGNVYYLKDISLRWGMDGQMGYDQSISVYDARSSLIGDISEVEDLALLESYGDSVFKGNKTVQAAVDAFSFLGIVYNYYLQVHGWNSWDGNGSTINAVVNLGDDEWVNNACWWGYRRSMFFGLGDGYEYYPFSAALDVVAHEFQHAVTASSADLRYESQSGAINESFSDFFGAMIDRDDWLMGEDLYSRGGFIRNIANPPETGYPDHMSRYKDLPVTRDGDWGGVHWNMLIPCKAYYLMSEGGTFEGVEVAGFGKDKLELLLFYTLTNILVPTSSFEDCRQATVQAANILYSDDPAVAQSVERAWAAVGVGSLVEDSPELLPPKNLVLRLKERGVELNWLSPAGEATAGVEVSGTVRREDAGPVANTLVVLQDKRVRDNKFTTLASSSGAFQFSSVPHGMYFLTVLLDLNGNSKFDPDDWQGFLDQDGDSVPDSLSVDSDLAGLSITMHPFASLGTGTVSGRVARIDGGSVAGGVVYLIEQGEGGYETEDLYLQSLGADGSFSFANVTPGNYTSLAWYDSDSDGEYSEGDFFGYIDENSDQEPDVLDIASGETISGISITMFEVSLTAEEVEPNDWFSLADQVNVGGGIKGAVYPADDFDTFVFYVDQAAAIEIDLDARSIGSPLDAGIGLFDESGALLAVDYYADGKDPGLVYDFTSPGTYYIGVGCDLSTGNYELRLSRVNGLASGVSGAGDPVVPGDVMHDPLAALGREAADSRHPAAELDPLALVRKRGMQALQPSGLGLLNTLFGTPSGSSAVQPGEQTGETPSGYKIYRSISANFEIDQYYLVAEVSGTTWIDRNVVNRQTYYYKATAVYPGGESGPSNTAQILFQFADQPGIAVSDTAIGFGTVALDSSSRKTIVVRNVGAAQLEVSSILSDNQAFLPVVTSFFLSPGASRLVEVVFRPTETGSYQGSLSIFSNDYGNPRRSVTLYGEAVVRTLGLLGDVNMDGAVNILDALIILSHLSGLALPQGVDLGLGDIDNNGGIDAADVNLILAYTVGLPTPYPVGRVPGSETGIALAAVRPARSSPQTLSAVSVIRPAGSAGDGYLGYALPLPESVASRPSNAAAWVFEATWDASLLSFEGVKAETSPACLLQVNAVKGGSLLLAVLCTGSPGQEAEILLSFRPLRGLSSPGPAVAVRWVEMYDGSFELCGPGPDNGLQRNVLPGPGELALDQNQPNPFNPSTAIRFRIPEAGGFPSATHLEIYSLRGRKIKTLVNQTLMPGNYTVIWDGTDEQGRQASSGVYFFRLRHGPSQLTRKMILMK